MTPLRTRLRTALSAVVTGALAAGAARAQDPFPAGLAWRAPAPLAQPAVPRAVALAARGGIVWTASNGANPGFDLIEGFGAGTVTRRFHRDAPAGALGVIAVSATEAHEALFGLVQVPAPDALHRATLVERYDVVAAAQGAPFAPSWTFDSGWRTNGPARAACDASGARLVVAAWDGATQQVRVDFLSGASGASLATTTFAAAGLSEIALAADGSTCVLACGTALRVLDGTGALVQTGGLSSATSAVSLSDDGAWLAHGGGKVTLLARAAGAFAFHSDVLGNAGEIAARVALSGDGSTLAIAWWEPSTTAVRLEVRDVASGQRWFETVLPGNANGLQNAAEALSVTRDGGRVALGSWGDGASAPELVLWDRATNALVLAEDLPGSVLALDLDASGTRVVVGVKAAHANQFASTGEFRVYETGERELRLLSPARPGGALQLAARHPGASGVVFLAGPLAPQPVFVPGAVGALLLERTALSVRRIAADASGRADTSWALPNDPSLVGTTRHLQVAFRVNGVHVLGPTVLDVLVF